MGQRQPYLCQDPQKAIWFFPPKPVCPRIEPVTPAYEDHEAKINFFSQSRRGLIKSTCILKYVARIPACLMIVATGHRFVDCSSIISSTALPDSSHYVPSGSFKCPLKYSKLLSGRPLCPLREFPLSFLVVHATSSQIEYTIFSKVTTRCPLI